MTQESNTREFFNKNYSEVFKLVMYIIHHRISDDDVHEIISGFYLSAYRNKLIEKYESTKSSFNTYIFIMLKRFIIATYIKKRKYPVYIRISDIYAVEDDQSWMIDVEDFLSSLSGIEAGIATDIVVDISPKAIAKKYNMTQQGIVHYRTKIRAKWDRYKNTALIFS